MRAKAIFAATESAARQNDLTQTTVAVSVILMMELMPRKRPVQRGVTGHPRSAEPKYKRTLSRSARWNFAETRDITFVAGGPILCACLWRKGWASHQQG